MENIEREAYMYSEPCTIRLSFSGKKQSLIGTWSLLYNIQVNQTHNPNGSNNWMVALR